MLIAMSFALRVLYILTTKQLMKLFFITTHLSVSLFSIRELSLVVIINNWLSLLQIFEYAEHQAICQGITP